MIPASEEYGDLIGQQLEHEGATVTAYGRELRPLTLEEVKSTIESEIQQSYGGIHGEIAEQRRKALQFYHGRPFGNEQEGRSNVILTDVADTVEWVMPQLMRMFTGGEKIVSYEPKDIEHVQWAKEATAYVNKVFRDDMDGFTFLHDFFKTALLEKNGFGKVYTDVRMEPVLETYRELDKEQLVMLLEDESLEVVAYDEVQGPVVGVDPETGEEIRAQLFDLKVRKTAPVTRLKVDGIAPEEFLIARRSIRLDDDTPFCAQRKKLSASALISMGFPADRILSMPVDDSPEFTPGRTERFEDEDRFPVTAVDRADAASIEHWVTECYMHIDEDGDGYAERRMFMVVGDTSVEILDDEEVEQNPFFSLTPVPMPHKFFGLSMADLVMDLQLIRSTLLRQMLDNLYIVNNQRTVIEDGAVELDDLLVSRPGGVIRAEHVEAVKPLESTSFGPMPFHMLEYLEEVRQNRTGITRYTQGMDASSLNHTATGVNMVMNAAQMRIELVARIFANTGLKRMFSLMLRELVTGPYKEERVLLDGEWASVNPRRWPANMGVKIQVGLGVGQAAERVANLQKVLEVQGAMEARGLGGFMVTPENLHNAVSAMVEAMGFSVPGLFFTDPAGREPPPPPPDPKRMEAELEQQMEPLRVQIKEQEVKIKAMQQAALADNRQRELDQKLEIEKMRIASRERIEMAKIEAEREQAREERARRLNGSGEEART